jgi:pimeloyl-ACP methyl ester carboxylesterase
MKQNDSSTQQTVRSISSIAAITLMATAATGAQTQEPLVIEEQGSFFVNEERITTDYPRGDEGNALGHIVVNDMYVQYQIPKNKRPDALPVIMMHGSGHTGKTYETTPDGRMGWAEYFVRQGFPVYVVDQVGRARSGFDPTPINQARLENNASLIPPGGQVTFTLEAAWSVFRFGPEPFVWYDNTQFPREALNEYGAQLVPNTESTLTNPRESVDALAALLDKIGPAIIFVHSQSGTYGMGAVVERPNLVEALVNVEGDCTLSGEISENDADRQDVIAAFTGGRSADAALLTVFGDFVGGTFWELIEQTCIEVVNAINEGKGTAFNLNLPQQGLIGNSHMLMMDENNLKVAELILKWLDENALNGNSASSPP